MIELPHGPSGLSRATWTDADFPSMGWHDCRIRALSIGEYDDDDRLLVRILLDLDYIVRWVEPGRGQRHFTFWVCPATLVFEEVWDINGQLGPLHDLMEIADIHRTDTADHQPDPAWHIEGHDFDVRFRAAGYTQYLRVPPRHVDRQVLTEAERSGISFAEHPFA